MNNTFIYELIDPKNGVTRYIGKTNNIDLRFDGHIRNRFKYTSHKNNWIKQLLSEDLKPIINVIDEVPINEWPFWERYWIAQYKAWGFNLTNSTDGGEGLLNPTKEIREKISKGNMGKPSPFKNKKHTKEGLIKKSENMIGKNLGKKYKSNNINQHTLRKQKPVFKIDLNNNILDSYTSIKEAALKNNLYASLITRVCKGKLKKHGGFIWEYK